MIYIEQPKAPLIIWAVLKDIRKAKIEFTPDIMLTLLKCTNHPTSIRDLLKEIPSGKEADFKEAILGMVDRRKHTDTNLETMRNIANIGGFSEEFENIHAKDKWIKPHYDVSVFVAKSQNDLTNNKDLSGYDALICDFSGKVYIGNGAKLPGNCDFSKCSELEIAPGYYNSDGNYCHEDIDLSDHCLKIAKGADITFRDVIPPKGFDFSQCGKIKLYNPDLRYYNLNAKDAKLYINHNFYDKDNARCIDLSDCNNAVVYIDFFHRYSDDTPDIKVIGGKNLDFTCHSSDYDLLDLDFSNTDKLTLNANCWGVKGIKFKEGASLTIFKNIPKGVDFSMFDEINFTFCLPDASRCILKDGVNVKCYNINLDGYGVDFSKCGKIEFLGNICRSSAKTNVFTVRDRAQRREIEEQLEKIMTYDDDNVFEYIKFENKSSFMNKIISNWKER